MKFRFLCMMLPAALLVFSCKDNKRQETDPMEGIVVNEVSPGKTIVAESWIELYNTTGRSINLRGMRLLLTTNKVTEAQIAELQGGEIAPGGWFVINSKDVNFSVPVIIADFEEIIIADGEGSPINAFSVKYDLQSTAKPLDGGSFARIPDGTGSWCITDTATPGARNYKIEPHNITGLIFNEVCPSQKWVEIVNTYNSDAKLEYAYLKASDGTLLHTFPEGTVLAAGARMALDLNCDAALLGNVTLYNNEDKKVDNFVSTGLAAPADGQSWSRLPDITGAWRVTAVPTKGQVNVSVTSNEDGLVLNEASLAGWVEIANTTLEDIKTSGVTVKINGTSVYESGTTTFKAGKKVAFNATVTNSSTIALYGSNGTILDQFTPSMVQNKRTAGTTTSWSRIPDGTGKWYTVITPSKAGTNYGIIEGNKIAIWVNQSSMESCDLEGLCKLGIGNIIIHEFIFRSDKHNINDTKAFLSRAHALGFKVHIWMQCFWWADTEWTSAVIDPKGSTPASYNYPVFNEIINRGLPYLNYDIDGIHFDYIRFGGSAPKHNYPDQGVTAVGAITEFCRMASEAFRAKRSDIVLSAALMGEAAPMNYYGQDPSQMSKYIDIFMPMAYISSYNYTSAKNASVANWFADHDGNSQTWHGFSTYDAATHGLSASTLMTQIKNIVENSHVDGIALFRYGLGDYPDLNAYYK